jgi:hypothetical protein
MANGNSNDFSVTDEQIAAAIAGSNEFFSRPG